MQSGDSEEANPPTMTPKNHASPKVDDSITKKLASGAKPGSSKATSGTTSPAKSANANFRSSMAKTSPASRSQVPTKKTARATLQTKTPEELLSEILELKKALSMAKDENSTLKAKLRRSEDENNRKEKQIYQLSMGVTKTESQKHTTNSAVNNLKRRIEKLEMTLKDKENQIKKLQSDARATKQESFRRSSESPSENSAKRTQGLARDVGRRLQISHGSPTTRSRNSLGSTCGQNAATGQDVEQLKIWLRRALCINEDVEKEYESLSTLELIAEIKRFKEEIERNKALHEEIHKLRELDVMSSDNTSNLQAKQAVLRADMEKLVEEVKSLKADRSAFYETIEKKDLEVTRLKEELDKARKESTKTKPKQTASSPTGNRRSIHGTPAAKVPALKTATSSASPSATRTHSNAREVTTKQAITASKGHPNSAPAAAAATNKSATRKTRTSLSPTKVLQTKVVVEVPTNGHPPEHDAEAKKKDTVEVHPPVTKDLNSPEVEHFRQNLAAKKIQKSWKSRHHEEVQITTINEENRDAKLRAIQENHAAKVIQKGWKASKQNEQEADESAVVVIQSTIRGHTERTDHLESLQNDIPDDRNRENESIGLEPSNWKDDLDGSATIIQAAARGHFAREEMLRKWEGMNGAGTVLQD